MEICSLPKQTVKQKFPKIDGLFSHMDYSFKNGVTKGSLDIMFLANYGKRVVSPIVTAIQDNSDEPLTSQETSELARIILEMYKERWDRLGKIYDIEYDPIHNFLDRWSDTSNEVIDREVTENGTDSTTYGKVSTDSITRNDTTHNEQTTDSGDTKTLTNNLQTTSERTSDSTETQTDDLETATNGTTTDSGGNSQNDKVYGFNSTEGVNSSSTSGTDGNTQTVADTQTKTGTRTVETEDSSSDTVKHTGTATTTDELNSEVTNDGTYSRTVNGSNTLSGSDTVNKSGTTAENATNDIYRSGSHSGNIGNITSQQMISEEIKLWKWNYMNEILNDVKEFCTLSVYVDYID